MRLHRYGVAILAALALPVIVEAQLYTEDFDTDHSANWLLKANEGFGQSPSDGVGEPDATADFFFDYSDVGIPSAPNSTGGTTRGMKIQANLIAGIFGAASASPVGQSFTGDYKVKFDMWGNYVGDPTLGLTPGGVGQSMMVTSGIMVDGVTGVAPGVLEGVWFAAMVDGGSTADFRAYSKEREISYQLPIDAAVLDEVGQPIDGHATYHGGVVNRNSSQQFYMDNFGGVSAPAAQVSEYPQQLGTTPLGSVGMEWHAVEIAKIGNLVTWTMDGVLLITVDMTNFVSTDLPDGNNIFFGHSDINAGSSAEPSRFDLQFALFDNIVVEAVEVGQDGDHNGDGVVDTADFVAWAKDPDSFGGDPAGYDEWKANFGEPGAGGGGIGAVPEPGSVVLAIVSLFMAGACGRRATRCKFKTGG
jgi:hypothetical protein